MTVAAVAVVVAGPLVLVGRRGADARAAAGCDEFPGGKVERGETPAAAAARECLEETGIAVTIAAELDVQDVAAQGPRVHFFAATPCAGQPLPQPPFRWVPIVGLDPARFPPANARVLSLLARTAAAGQGGS